MNDKRKKISIGMEERCAEGLAQIETQHYAALLEYDGYQEILKYAACFFKKGCIVRNCLSS